MLFPGELVNYSLIFLCLHSFHFIYFINNKGLLTVKVKVKQSLYWLLGLQVVEVHRISEQLILYTVNSQILLI